jgi:release factor glutamine methyltransferase
MGPGNNRLKDWSDYIFGQLPYSHEESGTIVELLIRYKLGKSSLDIIRNPDTRISESEILELNRARKRLLASEPIQYVVGETEFYDCRIRCDKRALIPRPETEELVELMITDDRLSMIDSVLDIGTGTGCIPIAIKKNRPEWKVTATDVSEHALNLARENAQLNGVEVDFRQDDFANSKLEGPYDLIVSNPPYVLESERESMATHVVDHEPHLALFSAEDELYSYRHILELSRKILSPKGSIYLELNALTAKQVLELYKTEYPSSELVEDISGKQRFLRMIRE